MTTATTTADDARAATSKGGNTSVSCVGPTTGLIRTRTGVSSSATCSGLLRVVLITYSGLALRAKRIPTAFSTELDAIATTTKPVKVCDKPRLRTAGCSGPTNQSDARAAPRLATA